MTTQDKIIPTGYKQTEVGVIPTDWNSEKLQDVSNISRGGSPRPIENYLTNSFDGINWIKIGDVGVNSKYIESTKEKIVQDGVSRSRYVCKGDFLLSNSMSFGRPYILKIDGCIHDGWLVIQKYKENFNTDFLYYFLGSNFVIQQYKAMASGSSVLNLNKEIVGKVNVLRPPLAEQTRIATVLSDIDELITQMDELIAKKKAIKQGAMQLLLTPKKDWEVKKLENIVTINKGSQINKSDLTLTGKYPCLNGGVEASGYTDKYNTEKDTITISEGGNSCGYINYNTQRLWCGGHCYAVRIINEKNNDKLFLFNILKFKESLIMGLRVGSGLPNIQKKSLYEFEVVLPNSKQEQIRIATILSDMDQEIHQLEEKKSKYEQLKQGAMQQLLTGKIRLK